MAKDRKSASAGEEDDSLLVHPATQGASADESQAANSDVDTSPNESDDAQVDSQAYWEAEEILDEVGKQYLISWKGKDEDGEPYKPTWEPKDNANELLIASWIKYGKPKKEAEKKRRKEEKAKEKSAKKAAKQRRLSGNKPRSSTTASTSTSTTRNHSIEVDEPAPPKKAKRKMVLSDSESSQQSQPQPVKKQKAVEVREKKKVAFDIMLDDSDDEVAQQLGTQPQPQPQATVEAVSVQADEQEPEPVSSGGTSASVIPDSQAVVVATPLEAARLAVEEPVDDSQGSSGMSASQQRRQVTGLNSPATSHSDLEMQPAGEKDDPLDHGNDRLSPAAEAAPVQRRLGLVPVPSAASFGLHHPVSSQLDRIEDPDSSPARSPFRNQQNRPAASPSPLRARTAKPRLQLVAADEDDSASPADLPLPSSGASLASLASLPIIVSTTLARLPGASPVRPFDIRPATSTTAVKRRPFRPPTPPAESEIGAGGAAGAALARPAAAPRPATPEVVEETQFISQEVEGDFADEFFNDLFDFDAAAEMSEVPSGKAAGEANDAGEGYPPNGHQPYGGGAPPAGGAGGASQHPGPSHIPGYIAGPPGMPPPMYGYGGPSGFYGGGFPPMHLPPAHAGVVQPFHQPPPKREHDGEEDSASKRARTDEYGRPLPPHASYPAYGPPLGGSGYYAPPHLSPFTTQPLPASQSSPYPQYPAARPPPAVNVISPSPSGTVALSSPSLARVQSMEPFGASPAASPVNGRSAPSAPAPSVPAGAGTSHRSPSPNPPPAISAAFLPPSSPSVPGSSVPGFSLSRNSSPAPGGAKVDEIIALVKTSPHILETDETMPEIEKFLRDPKGYSANPDAPLLRSEFWPFELRHVTVDGVEKVDFIILRSREGTFQLKRATVGKVPVDFARSLAHTSTRERGMTPAVDAVPTLATSSPAPGPPPAPPAPSTMTRDQLEQEVERLRLATQAFEAELTTARPAVAEVATLKAEVAALQKTNKQLQNSRDSAQQDLSYVQAQYQIASNAASDRANEATAAEAEIKRLNILLDSGLKQKELLHAAKEKQIKDELKLLRKQVKFIQETTRRTNEHEVREKASRWDDHVAAMEIKAADEARRAKGEATMMDDADNLDDDERETAQSSIAEESLVSAAASSDASRFITTLVHGNVAIGAFPSSSAASSSMAEPSTLLDSSTMLSSGTGSAEADYRCEWRVGTDSQAEACGAVCPSKEMLHEHVLGHIPSSA
ncbi:hypothetical protein JCM8097_008605 [Rhodosporidiobolus ruineniae]